MEMTKKIITDFMTDSKVSFYTSSVDGTLCVEWFDMGRMHTATATDLARRILRFRKEAIANAKKAA